jgi:hypothetical protein
MVMESGDSMVGLGIWWPSQRDGLGNEGSESEDLVARLEMC